MTAIVHLQGHLGKDASVNTVNGQTVLNMVLATSERMKEGESSTTWWRLSYWQPISDKLRDCLKKGAALNVIALLKTPSIYTDQQGNNKVQMDGKVVHFGFPPFGRKDKQEKTSSQQQESKVQPIPQDDDYLPF